MSKRVLQWSIVVLGTGLSLHQVVTVGTSSLPVLAGTLTAALVMAVLVGRMLHLERDTRTLIGVGTAICGASAIAATNAVIDASEADVAYAIGTIFTFNIVAVLAFPPLGHLIGMSQHSFGLWSGTAINDTSSVVAASSVYGHAARNYAVVVKLTRTLMIIPIVVALAIWKSRQTATDRKRMSPSQLTKVIPWFIAWFLIAASLDTLHVIPSAWHSSLTELATVMITAALAAIGLSTRVRTVRAAGLRPLILGAVLWATVAFTSIGIQAATGKL